MTGMAAAAPGATVLVTVRSTDATDPAPYELRLRSELSAEGIDAIVVNPNAIGGDSKQAAARFGANAVVEVTISTSEVTSAVWVADPGLSLEVTRNLRVSNQQRDAVAVFALRSVDLLQGARLELEQQRRSRLASATGNAPSSVGSSGSSSVVSSPAVATPQTKSQASREPKPATPNVVSHGTRVAAPRTSAVRPGQRNKNVEGDAFRLSLGYALMLTTDGFGWSTAPTVSLAWRGRSRWGVSVVAAAPFINHINHESAGYRVTVDQELLKLDVRRSIAVADSFSVEPHVGLGGSRYAASGSADAPLVGHVATAWSTFAVAGSAVLWHLGSHLHFILDVAGFARWQAPHIEVGRRDLTDSSRWNLLLTAGIGWSF